MLNAVVANVAGESREHSWVTASTARFWLLVDSGCWQFFGIHVFQSGHQRWANFAIPCAAREVAEFYRVANSLHFAVAQWFLADFAADQALYGCWLWGLGFQFWYENSFWSSFFLAACSANKCHRLVPCFAWICNYNSMWHVVCKPFMKINQLFLESAISWPVTDMVPCLSFLWCSMWQETHSQRTSRGFV